MTVIMEPENTMTEAQKALHIISKLKEDASYTSVTKTDLWEALKYARHVAKAAMQNRLS